MKKRNLILTLVNALLILVVVTALSCSSRDTAEEKVQDEQFEEFSVSEYEDEEATEDEGQYDEEYEYVEGEEYVESEESEEFDEELAEGEELDEEYEYVEGEEGEEFDEEYEYVEGEEGEEFDEEYEYVEAEEGEEFDERDLEDELAELEGQGAIEDFDEDDGEIAEFDSEPTEIATGPTSDEIFAEPPQERLAPAPVRAYRLSRAPTIPPRAVERNGSQLNRYHFVRQGDSASSLARLIYGDDSRSAELLAWNEGTQVAAGNVFYYSSPSEPNDPKMRSFFQERGVVPGDYRVQTGDWLSKIANREYGSFQSWKEIATLNGFSRPDQVTAGKVLSLYPAELSVYAYQVPAMKEKEQVATEEFSEKPQLAQTEMMEKPQGPNTGLDPVNQLPEPPDIPDIPPERAQVEQVQPPTAPPQAPVQAPPPVPPVAEEPVKDFSQEIQDNLFAYALIGFMVLLILVLIGLKRRKRAKKEEEFEDTVTKSRLGGPGPGQPS